MKKVQNTSIFIYRIQIFSRIITNFSDKKKSRNCQYIGNNSL